MSKTATIGFFDGVHAGHRYLFEQMQAIASERGLQPLIVTFDVHPRAVLHSDYVPQLLTTLEERKALLSAYGEVVVLPFAEIYTLTAKEFMLYLKERHDVSILLMGYDHQFGSDRLRKPQEYRHTGELCGIEVRTMREYSDGEWHVSSTEIRHALESGNIAIANELLGRPYQLGGHVVHGNGIGRTLGFPTANIMPDNRYKVVPRTGVYAVYVRAKDFEWTPAMLNIGTNPTVGNEALSIEIHIPSFNGDLYGQQMDIRFERFIREEKRFGSLQELREQIARDISSLPQ
jgi:riboflavin kinase/FMN adenylyltransferase